MYRADQANSAASGGLSFQEFEAGPDHLIVLYLPPDLSTELDPAWIFGSIAADATSRAASGLRMLSMTAMPLRHPPRPPARR